MSADKLKAAMLVLIEGHPEVAPSHAAHTSKLHRFVTKNGRPIAFEHRSGAAQNIWVEADSLSPGALSDLERRPYDQADFGTSKPNHHLFTEPAFVGCDLVCIKARSWWDVARIVREVAGDGGGA